MSQLVASGAPAFAQGDSRPRAGLRLVRPRGKEVAAASRDLPTGGAGALQPVGSLRQGLEVRARLLGTRGPQPIWRFPSLEASFLVRLLSVVLAGGGAAAVGDARRGNTAPATWLATRCWGRGSCPSSWF